MIHVGSARSRFLNFSSRSPDLEPKSYAGPGLDKIPAENGALPEQDRYTGPMNDIPGGDNKNGPSRFIKDVPVGEGIVIGDPSSAFNSVEDYIPRDDPRDIA